MIGAFSADISVIESGIPFFRTCSFDYLCVLLVFSMNGYLNGRGKTIFTMLSCCFGALALRIAVGGVQRMVLRSKTDAMRSRAD